MPCSSGSRRRRAKSSRGSSRRSIVNSEVAEMQFGLYAPIPMATVGSPEVAQAVREALVPLPAGRRDAQFDLAVELLEAADGAGFELVLFAERHLGNDLAAWVLASAIGPRLAHIRALVAVHPGLW